MINRRCFLKAIAAASTAAYINGPLALTHEDNRARALSQNQGDDGVYIDWQWIGNLLSFESESMPIAPAVTLTVLAGGVEFDWLAGKLTETRGCGVMVVIDGFQYLFDAVIHHISYTVDKSGDSLSVKLSPSGEITILQGG